jgi:hypothetical protein
MLHLWKDRTGYVRIILDNEKECGKMCLCPWTEPQSKDHFCNFCKVVLSGVGNDDVTTYGFVIGLLRKSKIRCRIRNSQDTEGYPEPVTFRPHPFNIISFISVTKLFWHPNLRLHQAVS